MNPEQLRDRGRRNLQDYLKTETQVVFADRLGVTQGQISQWVNGLREIPAIRAMQIEHITGGGLKAKNLRPDLKWPEHA